MSDDQDPEIIPFASLTTSSLGTRSLAGDLQVMNHPDHRGKLTVDWLLPKLCAKLINACLYGLQQRVCRRSTGFLCWYLKQKTSTKTALNRYV